MYKRKPANCCEQLCLSEGARMKDPVWRGVSMVSPRSWLYPSQPEMNGSCRTETPKLARPLCIYACWSEEDAPLKHWLPHTRSYVQFSWGQCYIFNMALVRRGWGGGAAKCKVRDCQGTSTTTLPIPSTFYNDPVGSIGVIENALWPHEISGWSTV